MGSNPIVRTMIANLAEWFTRLTENQIFLFRCLVNFLTYIATSASGKLQDFDPCISMVRIHPSQPHWGLAQLAARQVLTLKVGGSIPSSPAIKFDFYKKICYNIYVNKILGGRQVAKGFRL